MRNGPVFRNQLLAPLLGVLLLNEHNVENAVPIAVKPQKPDHRRKKGAADSVIET